jgi:hypothetical protein
MSAATGAENAPCGQQDGVSIKKTRGNAVLVDAEQAQYVQEILRRELGQDGLVQGAAK